jgi:hypothetical protein
MQPNDLPCHGRPGLFIFDPRNTPPVKVQSAKALCARCPMRQACLERWMRLGEPDGSRDEVIVGGTTKAERDALRARACVAVAA